MTRYDNTAANYYSTSDLALATAISLSYPLDSITGTNPRKATFLFKRSKKLNRLVELYWQGKLKVNPTAYFNQLKSIKSRLYEERCGV